MDSKKFNDWWSTVVKMHGYAPNPDDPLHYYDYRAAFNEGHGIPEDGQHWSSKFKHDLHPNRFVRGSDPSVNKPDIEFWDTKYEKPATSADFLKSDSLRQDFERMLNTKPAL
tara:strand:- start:199 stop:534 length:336 start_codon:yes stop_codon:yes gene_type:complete